MTFCHNSTSPAPRVGPCLILLATSTTCNRQHQPAAGSTTAVKFVLQEGSNNYRQELTDRWVTSWSVSHHVTPAPIRFTPVTCMTINTCGHCPLWLNQQQAAWLRDCSAASTLCWHSSWIWCLSHNSRSLFSMCWSQRCDLRAQHNGVYNAKMPCVQQMLCCSSGLWIAWRTQYP